MARAERVETIRGYRYIRLKSGRLLTFWEAIRGVESRHAALGLALSRACGLADHDDDLERIDWALDRLQEHIDALRGYLVRLRGTQSKRARIAALRNVEGRTPEEAAGFLRKADKLERELETAQRAGKD